MSYHAATSAEGGRDQGPLLANAEGSMSSQPLYEETVPIDYSKLDKAQNIEVVASPPLYPDAWAIQAYLAALIGFFVLAGLAVPYARGDANPWRQAFSTPILPTDVNAVLAIAICLGFVLSSIYLMLVQRFAGRVIHASFIAFIGIQLGTAILFATYGAWAGAAISLLMATLLGWFYYSCRFRIPLAKVLLQTVIRITWQFPATLASGYVAGLVSSAFSILWLYTALGLVLRYKDADSATMYGLLVYMLFISYWTAQVISNVVHVTVSGLFATVYLMGTWDTVEDRVTVPMPHPTLAAARRAMTTSFGPICFGSLLIAALQTLRQLAHFARDRNDQDQHPGLAIVFCVLQCIMGCMQDILEFFTHYAFVEVAIYGKGYIEAGKSTWELFQARGFDILINDNFIGTVLSVGSLAVGILCGVGAYVYGVIHVSGIDKELTCFLFALVAFIVGVFIFITMTTAIGSGVTATYVCMAEDPATVARGHPELFGKVQAVYPTVNWGARSYVQE